MQKRTSKLAVVVGVALVAALSLIASVSSESLEHDTTNDPAHATLTSAQTTIQAQAAPTIEPTAASTDADPVASVMLSLFAHVSCSQLCWTIGLASVFLLIAFIQFIRVKPVPGVPYMPGHWLLGHFSTVSANFHRLHDWHAEAARKLNAPAYQMLLPGMEPLIFLVSEENMEYYFKSNFWAFEKGRLFRDQFEELLGEGIFNVDGDSWREKRKTASHMFSEKVVREDMYRIFAKHTQAVLVAIRERSVKTGEHIDFQTLFFQFTIDTICEIAFGKDIDSINTDCQFGRSFDIAQQIIIHRFFVPPFYWKLKRFLRIGQEGALRKHIRVLRDFCDKIIRERQEVKQDQLRKFPDLLSRFISEARDRGETLSLNESRDIILNFMIAGRDTTACLVTWAAWEVWHHPDEEKKLIEEIKKVRDNSANKSSEFWIPTYTEISQLTYLDAFLHEVLRLHPSVPSDGKLTVKECVLPDGGYRIPSGVQVGFNPYAIARQPRLWGRDADVLNPSRWLAGPKPSQNLFPHFNGGLRVCLGQHIAILEAKVMFASLLAAYEWRVPFEHDPAYIISVVLPMRDGLPALCTTRSK